MQAGIIRKKSMEKKKRRKKNTKLVNKACITFSAISGIDQNFV
jgi:hypothetical protein